VWTAITSNQRDTAFIKSNLGRIEDIVSEAIKKRHPRASQLSETHTQAWQTHATEALCINGTLLAPTPAVSIIFPKPFTKWADVHKASQAPTGLSHLTPINTSPFARKCKYEQWILPASQSVSRGSGTSSRGGQSRSAWGSGHQLPVAPRLIPLWLDGIVDGFPGDQED
jgi:hypothetical protein